MEKYEQITKLFYELEKDPKCKISKKTKEMYYNCKDTEEFLETSQKEINNYQKQYGYFFVSLGKLQMGFRIYVDSHKNDSITFNMCKRQIMDSNTSPFFTASITFHEFATIFEFLKRLMEKDEINDKPLDYNTTNDIEGILNYIKNPDFIYFKLGI